MEMFLKIKRSKHMQNCEMILDILRRENDNVNNILVYLRINTVAHILFVLLFISYFLLLFPFCSSPSMIVFGYYQAADKWLVDQ